MSAVAASQGEIVLRRMNAEDLPAVLHVQRRCYPDHLIESLDALASRQRLSPDTCWVAARRNALLGYLFAHPWRGDQPPSLNQPLRALPPATDTLFIHDLALHPQARGHGLGPKLVGQALRQGRKLGLRHSRLVAVEGAAAWWRKHGYRGCALPHYPLNGYGDGAVSMQCEL